MVTLLVEGDVPALQSIVIFTFSSIDAIKQFLQSREYAPYKKARTMATGSNFFAFENDDNASQLIRQ